MRGVNRPRVVMVAGKLPEPVRGGLDLRIQGQLRALATFCDVTLIALHGRPGSGSVVGVPYVCLGGELIADTSALAAHVLAHPEDPYGPLFDSLVAQELAAVLRRLTPTAVVVSRLQSWIYAESIRSSTSAHVFLDLDESAARLCESFMSLPYTGIQRSLHLRFTAASARYERSVISKPDAIWVASEIERDFVQASYPEAAPVSVVVNAVDVPEQVPQHEHLGRFTVIFSGNFSYPPNIAAAQEIIQQIAPALSDMDFVLAGSHFPDSLGVWLPTNVRVLSPVTDMRTVLVSADAAVLPIRAGGGTRLKAIECMALGVPIVATDAAMEGLNVLQGKDFLIAHRTEEFATQLIDLARNPELGQLLISQAHAAVVSEYSTLALSKSLETSIAQLTIQH